MRAVDFKLKLFDSKFLWLAIRRCILSFQCRFRSCPVETGVYPDIFECNIRCPRLTSSFCITNKITLRYWYCKTSSLICTRKVTWFKVWLRLSFHVLGTSIKSKNENDRLEIMHDNLSLGFEKAVYWKGELFRFRTFEVRLAKLVRPYDSSSSC